MDLTLINNFIRKLNQSGELLSWSVALMNKTNSKNKFELSSNIISGCFTRNTAGDTNTYVIKKNHIVGNPTDEFIDLEQSVLDEALRISKRDKDWKNLYPKPRLVRENYRNVNNPLLIIYPIDPLSANPKDNNGNSIPEKVIFNENDDVIIGFAIVFPKSKTEHTVEFAINTALSNEYYQSEVDFDNDNDNLEDEE